MFAQHDHPATLISKVITSGGEKVSSSQDILEAFSQYYGSLYTSSLPSDFHWRDLSVLLDQVALGWLSDKDREALVHPITLGEVLMAIRHSHVGRLWVQTDFLLNFIKRMEMY